MQQARLAAERDTAFLLLEVSSRGCLKVARTDNRVVPEDRKSYCFLRYYLVWTQEDFLWVLI